jgi:hypothetical protein
MESKNNLRMNRENMKELFNGDPEIGPFLVNITESFNTCTSEIAHIDIINLFAENKFDVEHMHQYLKKYKYTYCATDNFIDNVLGEIINDYNTQYLDSTAEATATAHVFRCPCLFRCPCCLVFNPGCPVFKEEILRLNLDRISKLKEEEGLHNLQKRAKT